MAELNTDGGGGHGKHQKKRAKKSSTKVDMTPMVDLAFLLLTFFVLTATFGKPKTMEINMPVKPEKEDNTTKIEDEVAMTILLSEEQNVIYYYNGKLKPDTKLETTTFAADGLRKILLDRNKDVIAKVQALKERKEKGEIADSTYKDLLVSKEVKGNPKALFVIVKTDDKAKYKGVVDVLDELNICEVGKYAVVDISPVEKDALTNFKKL